MSGSGEEQTSDLPKWVEFVTTAEGSKSSEKKKSNYEEKKGAKVPVELACFTSVVES